MSTSKQDDEESSESKISISELLWEDCTSEALHFLYSPLFVHIAAGSLAFKEFNEYVANYAHLLNTFLEVYNLAAGKCVDDSDKAAFLGWSKNVEQELERHTSFYQQKLGFNPKKEIALHPATVKYKDFLLATASGNVQVSDIRIQQSKIPAYTLGAMTPSLRTNGLIKAVRELVSPPWIKESFEASYLHAEGVLDKLCNSLDQEEIEDVERLYRHALGLEMDFFFSRESEQTLIIPIHTKLDPKEEHLMLFVDFDFTCTSVASLKILANIEKFAQKPDKQLQGVHRDPLPQITSIDLRKTWELLFKKCTLENREFRKKIMRGKKAVSFDYEGLYSAFVELSSLEEQAVSRLFDSGVLKGISLEDIKEAGKCMGLHHDCLNFFEKVKNLDISVNVLSCWSGDLTRSALSGSLDMLKVDGNEFSYADGIFTGEVTRPAHQSVTAKLKYFKDMVQEYASEHGVGVRTVYIGDSINDLLCLLTADIGIVIGSNKRLIKVGNHFGITFLPLYAGVIKEQKKLFETGNPVWKGGLSGTLYTVTSWTEIHAFIFGRDLANCPNDDADSSEWFSCFPLLHLL